MRIQLGDYMWFGSSPPSDADPARPDAQMLCWAYCQGLFPMAAGKRGRIEWFCPDPRGIIPLDELQDDAAFHIPKNLARIVRQNLFTIRSDTAFEQVIRACSAPRSRENGTWLSPQLIDAYVKLHELGHAHSIEAWREGRLVGGLYGVHIGSAFFGESMFSDPAHGGSNSSKVCLVHLVRWLRLRGFTLLDTQFANEHLIQFGCIEIAADEYLAKLADAVRTPVEWGSFDGGCHTSSR